MFKKKLSLFALLSVVYFAVACGSGTNENADNNADNSNAATEAPADAASPGDATKGLGPHQNVELTHPLDQKMIAQGKTVYDVKCASCHKLSDERLVGPGWKGVTDRRTPEWIMNFVTNTEEMLQKDTAAQNMLEVCLVQMPNQNLTEQDARDVLEFMRENDGKQ